MNTQEYIQRHQQTNKNEQLQFQVFDDDAIIYNGRYKDMMLSDIFIIYPAFIDWLIGDSRIDKGLKMVAQSIKDDSEIFADNIQREISL